MKPFVLNDRWYITDEGYHVHPAAEDFTPGAHVELAVPINGSLDAAIAVLAGRTPAYLGMIDENSAREYHGRTGMGVLAVTAGARLSLPAGKGWYVMLGPDVGYGWLSEAEAVPTFGPSVTYGGAGQALVGGRAGLNRNPSGARLSFSAELLVYSMTAAMQEDGLQQRQTKFYGPFGILVGLSYSLK